MRTILLTAVTFLIAVHSYSYGEGLADSPHFIVSADNQAQADAVLAKAEAYRNKLAKEWFGDALPVDAKRTIIHVSVSAETDYGLTRIEKDKKDKYKCHMMWVVTSADRIESTLAHEMTHVVFGCWHHGRIPIWANEGAASLQDDPTRHAIRQRIITDFARQGNWPELTTVLESSRLANWDQLGYAASASVTEFLLSLDSKPTFLRFGIEGHATSWGPALSRYYGIRDIHELQRRWQNWVVSQLTEGNL